MGEVRRSREVGPEGHLNAQNLHLLQRRQHPSDFVRQLDDVVVFMAWIVGGGRDDLQVNESKGKKGPTQQQGTRRNSPCLLPMANRAFCSEKR